MRAKICMLIVFALLAGCPKKDEQPSKPPQDAAKVTQSKPDAGKPAPAKITVKDVGFQTPESVLYDATGDVYLVANINGTPLAKDGNVAGVQAAVSLALGRIVKLDRVNGGQKGQFRMLHPQLSVCRKTQAGSQVCQGSCIVGGELQAGALRLDKGEEATAVDEIQGKTTQIRERYANTKPIDKDGRVLE